MKLRVLFLDRSGRCCSQMAAAFGKEPAGRKGIEVFSAGLEKGTVDAYAVEVMAEAGLDIRRSRSLCFQDMEKEGVGLVVAMTRDVWESCLMVPGAPAVIRWDFQEPSGPEETGGVEQYRQVRDRIKEKVQSLFEDGCVGSILSLKRNFEKVLDHFTDGIVVHDMNRTIVWINQAAETLTGYRREEVIGRDCHDVFEEGLCGSQCSFCHEELPQFDKISYPVQLTTRDGHHKRAEVTVVGMRDDQGVFQGVLATFRDVTEMVHLRHTLRKVQSFHGIVGADEKMHEIYNLIRDLSASDCAVLVLGESGTGKELVAGAIHGESHRAGHPFVTVNCGALPEGILESELFGHVRGAFTGAVRDKKGRFELADGGTIFLDEVGELSANMQVKLLRVLQEGRFERVGGEESKQVDVRVVSATNRDLRKMVRQGRFREDLFYRLCVVPVELPPLRSRRNDIGLLVDRFMKQINQQWHRSVESVSTEAMEQMLDYSWPGNVRELQNAIQYAFVKCKGNEILEEHLPPEIRGYHQGRGRQGGRRKLTLESVESALRKCGGNKSLAAKELGVGRATLYRFFRESGVSEVN